MNFSGGGGNKHSDHSNIIIYNERVFNVGYLLTNYDSAPCSLESAFPWGQVKEPGACEGGEAASLSYGAERGGRCRKRE